ncbi:MAG: hypothetical protein OXG47_10080 [bacterium]|nr:hypothetical protein [bacterium]
MFRLGPRNVSSTQARNDCGLTTLEWLLIVAAVAGLAALAVVLVQNVVDETAEQVSEGSARVTAAQVAAKAITDDTDDTDGDKRSACNRLSITYSDAFADEKKAAFWSDPDGDSDTKDGMCFIVFAGVKKALEEVSKLSAVASLATCKTEIKKKEHLGDDPTAAQLGGGTLDHDDDATPECYLK